MKILMVAAEMAPYSTVGGLSQVVYFLSKSLIKKGHDVRVFTPKYGVIKLPKKVTEVYHHLKVPTGYTGKKYPRNLICNVLTHKPNRWEPRAYFLENREYYELRANVYQYKDDHIRFFLMSRGCLEWLKAQEEDGGWCPDIIHAHDWHASYLVDDVRKNSRYTGRFYKMPVLLTVHNFHLQGPKNYSYLPRSQRDKGKSILHQFFNKDLLAQNPLMRGIDQADWVNTVSEQHAYEVQTAEYGEGLEKLLTRHKGKLSGILNGLDTKEFNPKTDPLVKYPFDRKNLDNRTKNKSVLQKEFGLPVSDVPIIAYSGRLSKQKGIELIISLLPIIIEETDCQVIILGSGDNAFRRDLKRLKNEFPKRLGVYLFPNFKLPRKIFAGTDMVMLPSQFEPGGIVAIEALRYGAIPIVRKTGGLADIVKKFDVKQKTGNGFWFDKSSPWSFFAAIIRALQVFEQPKLWRILVKNAMGEDFSWEKVAGEYSDLYSRVIHQRFRLVQKNPHPARLPN